MRETLEMRDRLMAMYHYDPLTGVFTRKYSSPGVKKGAVAGHLKGKGSGYRYLRFEKGDYKASRVAWLFMTGKVANGFIDHINRNMLDDRFENLREATVQQNSANMSRWHSQKLKGTTRVSGCDTWQARICVNGKSIHLGSYKTQEEAHQVYVQAARHHFGEFASAGEPLYREAKL